MTETATPTGAELFAVQRLRLAEGKAPALSSEHEAARDQLWERSVRSNPTLFDGPVVACAELRRQDRDTLFLRWVPVTYRHYALRRVPGATALPSLFVNVVQPTDDGRILVARMAPWTVSPGRWQLPGGSVEPPGHHGVLDEGSLRGEAARELAEEVGIEVAPDTLRLWAVTRGAHGSVGLTHLAPSRPAAELRERFAAVAAAERAAGRVPELDAFALVSSPEHLTALPGPHVNYLEPIVRRYARTSHPHNA